jgi:general secretion pathway protein K
MSVVYKKPTSKIIFEDRLAYKNRGVALITVMLIVAIVAILATQMSSRLILQMQRSTNIALNQQAYWYAMGAESFSRRVLMDIFKKEPDSTNLSQVWAQGENSFPVTDGTITGEITDLQACFNLNALRESDKQRKTPSAEQKTSRDKLKTTTAKTRAVRDNKGVNNGSIKEIFTRLISGLAIEGVDSFEAEYMADALVDWLDNDDVITSAGGAEDSDYAAKAFPYLAANNYLASVNELRVVEHFSVPVINALKKYVCVLPNTNLLAVNVNTLTNENALLLKAILGISLADAQQAIAARDKEGFENIEDFFNLPELKQVKISPELKQYFVIDSDYFQFKVKASFNNSYFSLISILKVSDDTNINVISRTIGS